MKHLFKYLLFSLIFLIIGCNKSSVDAPDSETARTPDDVRQDFENFDFQPGVNDFSLESTIKGYYWNFRVIVPQGANESNKKPLIFNLHGGAQNNIPEAHKSTDCLISPGLEGIIDAFIISPNSNAQLWYEQNNQIQILALYDLATSYLPIDTGKIAITGYSDGGNGSWFYAQYYSNMFSAAIPMATSYNTAKNNGSIEPINIPLYVIHGENDTLFPVETTQGYINESKAAGSDIDFVIASGLDHYHPCDYVSYFREAANWLTTSVWN